jgi:membrane protease YdiL (CAAX protease family)
MSKQNKYDIFIILFAFIAIISFPWTLFIKNNVILIKTLQFSVYFIFFVALQYFIKFKSNLKFSIGKIVWRPFLLLLPALVVCFSNYFLGLFVPLNFVYDHLIWFDFLITITVVLNEETIFRGLIQKYIPIKRRLFRIVAASGVFSLFHIFNFFASMNPFDLIIIVYTFGLGLLLGIFYEFTNSLIPPMICHLLFNIFNNDLFVLFLKNIKISTFVLVNCAVALIAIIYICLIYIFYLRKIPSRGDHLWED